jgi:hypothetical protein
LSGSLGYGSALVKLDSRQFLTLCRDYWSGTQPFEAVTAALSEAVEEAAAELRPYDAEAFKSKSIDYASIEPDPDAEPT